MKEFDALSATRDIYNFDLQVDCFLSSILSRLTRERKSWDSILDYP